MKKKLVLFLVLAAIAVGSISAQSNVKNWISGEVSLFGGGARYERMLTPKFSAGADVYWSSFFFIWNELDVGVFGRMYPWEGKFFVELGLGFHTHTALAVFGGHLEVITGLAISPAAGWRIDFGRPGGFFITPGIKAPITMGINDYNDKFAVGIGFVPYFGLGGAF
ncbi:MAG: hypothetical protein LBP76_04800 [Treponema sp.]|jgi:hypothetical protein|nr:hypothetical protein [Treponema sp.]